MSAMGRKRTLQWACCRAGTGRHLPSNETYCCNFHHQQDQLKSGNPIQRTLLAWLPILGLALIKLIPRAYFCSLVGPDKEVVCGYEYAHITARLAVGAYSMLSVIAFSMSGWYAYEKRLSKVGGVGLIISALLGIFFIWAKIYFGNEDSP